MFRGAHVKNGHSMIPQTCILQPQWRSSVTNSSSGLIFVKIRAKSGRIFSKNPDKIRVKIRAKIKFRDYVVFL